MPAAHQVQVHVKNGLTAVEPGVHEDAVAVLVDLEFDRQVAGFEHHATEQIGILRANVIERVVVAVGDDQDMHRRAGMAVPEGRDELILVNHLGIVLPRRDTAEGAVLFGHFH